MRNSTRYARSARGFPNRSAMGFPQRGDRTLRSVGAEEAAAVEAADASLELVAKLKMAKDVVVNTVESAYPWAGLAAGFMFRRNALIRYAAPVVGLAIGVARAMTHADDKVVAEVVKEVVGPPDPNAVV